jgi:transposase
MFGLTSNMKVFLAVEAADMRKSFNGLYTLVVDKLKEEPMDKALFIFTNKNKNRIKILHFDGTGLWVMAKRLEKGTFSWPKGIDVKNGKLALSPEALSLLLDGVDLKGGQMRPWYQRNT